MDWSLPVGPLAPLTRARAGRQARSSLTSGAVIPHLLQCRHRAGASAQHGKLATARHHGFGPCLRLSQISPLDPITIQTIAARAVLDIDPQAVLVGADRDQEGARVVVIGVAAGVLDLSRPDRTFDPFRAPVTHAAAGAPEQRRRQSARPLAGAPWHPASPG